MFGLGLQLTHTGVSKGSLFLSDVQDGVDLLHSFKKAGNIYVPYQATIIIDYTSSVSLSFEVGAIRGFINRGLLNASFIIGPTLTAALAIPISPQRFLTTADSPAIQNLSDIIVVYDLTAGPGTYELLPAAQWAGKTLRLKKYDLSYNPMTIIGALGETIDQAPTAVFPSPMAAIDLYSDGTIIKILG